ncbi:MAG: D-alanyl-D-alanine carboxypeptidase [Chloroflexi bacterium]|nr:D-alanyl-D-alanine carboxypeptidase [Chloroflexota bacterium]
MHRIPRAASKALLATVVLWSGTLGWATNSRTLAGGLGPLTTTLAYPVPPVFATSVAVMDADTGQWLRVVNPDASLPMASTTKIMTAIIAIQHGHLQDLVRVSHAAAAIGQSSMGLVEGEHVRMYDLLYGLMLPSGNDAAIAIGEHIAGSVPKFVEMMNAKASALHLFHTHYVTPYGFSDTPDGDDPAHYSSARDLVELARYALRDSLFRKIVSTATYVVPATKINHEHKLRTVNYFLNWYPGAGGVKPGWTSGAGVCQVIEVHRNGRHLIAAILHTPNVYTDVRDLMNYALGDFTWVSSGFSGDTPTQVVPSGTSSDPQLYFPFTGHSIRGPFVKYYKAHGGFNVFGAPRTESINVDGTLEQFFTNQILMYDPVQGAVVPQRLGFSALPSADWQIRTHKLPDTSWRRFYPQTGHTVTYRFLSFYLAQGGPRTFGYPITEKRYEGRTLVQYFENAELAWHPDATGSSGYVGVGPLGLRSLVGLGFITGDNLPPALHDPFIGKSPTPTRSPTATGKVSPTMTQSPIMTKTTTPILTSTMRPSASPTKPRPTHTPTSTATPPAKPTPTSSRTPTPAISPTRSPTPNATGSDTPVAPASP